MPLCPPVPCLPSVWVPMLSSAVPGHARVLAGETTLVVFAYRSDKHAAVLRLQRTQPKDRRAYDAPYRIPCMAGAGGGKLRDVDRGGRQRHGTSTRMAQRLSQNLKRSLRRNCPSAVIRKMDRKQLAHDSIMRFRKTDTMLRRYLDRKVSNTGVFPTQHRLLMELDRNPSCSQVDLAEKFDVSAAAIAVSLKKLEKGGYITRLADENDNRINQVSITAKGKEVIHKSILIFQETDRCFFEGFTDEEVEQFFHFMEKAYKNMAEQNSRLDAEERK